MPNVLHDVDMLFTGTLNARQYRTAKQALQKEESNSAQTATKDGQPPASLDFTSPVADSLTAFQPFTGTITLEERLERTLAAMEVT
ncbi:hypothetical protein Q7P36_000285 [Cladosporium allicinum]